MFAAPDGGGSSSKIFTSPENGSNDHSNRQLAFHTIYKTYPALNQRINARSLCLVISYDFARYRDFSRALGNSNDLLEIENFFTQYCDCEFQSISPSASDMRKGHTLSAAGIKEIFQTADAPTMFFLFILSHGLEQGEIMTDTLIDNKFDSFTTTDVLSALKKNDFLKDAVKLLFFGPCRGKNEEKRSVADQGFLADLQPADANKYATCVQSLPDADNYAIFYSTVESTKAVRLDGGTVMVKSFLAIMRDIKGDTSIVDFMTRMTKAISAKYSQMPQFLVFPHTPTFFFNWRQQINFDALGTPAVDYMHLGNGPFRRAFIFRDEKSKAVAGKLESSLNHLGFQVHCLELEKLMPTVTNISSLGMMKSEAWLLMFVFGAIEQVSVEGQCPELAVAANSDGALVPMGDVIRPFTGAKCSSYAEKPKVFFFLDPKGHTFDNAPTSVHQQRDIKSAINNHSGILVCSSADGEFIEKLPVNLEQMIAKRQSVQQVVVDLMETGRKRLLTRLWSTTPEEIRILERKECPEHPTVVHMNKAVTLSTLVQHLKIHRQIQTKVSAASEQERHAASIELYSQLVIELYSREILYLNTADYENWTKVQNYLSGRISGKKGESRIIVVVEDCGSDEIRDFLQEHVFPCDGVALIVSLHSASISKELSIDEDPIPKSSDGLLAGSSNRGKSSTAAEDHSSTKIHSYDYKNNTKLTLSDETSSTGISPRCRIFRKIMNVLYVIFFIIIVFSLYVMLLLELFRRVF